METGPLEYVSGLWMDPNLDGWFLIGSISWRRNGWRWMDWYGDVGVCVWLVGGLGGFSLKPPNSSHSNKITFSPYPLLCFSTLPLLSCFLTTSVAPPSFNTTAPGNRSPLRPQSLTVSNWVAFDQNTRSLDLMWSLRKYFSVHWSWSHMKYFSIKNVSPMK